jgi:hypothetical protein
VPQKAFKGQFDKTGSLVKKTKNALFQLEVGLFEFDKINSWQIDSQHSRYQSNKTQ